MFSSSPPLLSLFAHHLYRIFQLRNPAHSIVHVRALSLCAKVFEHLQHALQMKARVLDLG